ncbi:hypothetical protein, partial [Eubacterium pyruvativorans]|uniref:hypothetical protein n=1 Tax=Eubacterium pyruvativorans TaxID=155865 RepID=UPI0023F11140
RNYWLNTTMNVKPADAGWGGMGNLPTHFYEYNSLDANGNAIDLSVRQNSHTSTNHYTPVLTAEEAAKFTVENVLGGTDSWLPTEECVLLDAPVVSFDGSTLSWTGIDDARCYVVFKNGQYLTNQTATTLAISEDGVYSVRAANEKGGMGNMSTTVAVKRAIAAGKWSTIVVPFDMNDSQITTAFGSGTKVAQLTGFENAPYCGPCFSVFKYSLKQYDMLFRSFNPFSLIFSIFSALRKTKRAVHISACAGPFSITKKRSAFRHSPDRIRGY